MCFYSDGLVLACLMVMDSSCECLGFAKPYCLSMTGCVISGLHSDLHLATLGIESCHGVCFVSCWWDKDDDWKFYDD